MAEAETKKRKPPLGKQTADFARRRPALFCLLLLVLLYTGNIVRYAVLPPVWTLSHTNPAVTAFMAYRAAQPTGTAPPALRWRKLGAVSAHLRRAVVVSEDSTFWDHHGFDWSGIRLALEKNLAKARFASGGSTITQQLAKNLYFSPEKSITRKLQEAVVTWRLERNLSKERILEIYLNVVEWGKNTYGAEAAARRWFGVSAANLSKRQAAILAAMLPNPLGRRPNSPYVQRVASIIMRRM